MARTNATGTAGVALIQGKKSKPHELKFRHPLNGQIIKRSVQTVDYNVALDLARKLSTILQDPSQWGVLPDTTPAILKELWRIKATGETGKVKVLPMTPDELKTAMAYGVGGPRIVALRQENDTLKVQVITLQQKLDNALLMLASAGKQAAATYSPKFLAQAIEDYLSDDKKLSGTNAGTRKKGTLKSWLTRFKDKTTGNVLIHEITSQQVIEHLADMEAGKFADGKKPSHDTVRDCGEKILSFLHHQTRGTFVKQPVNEWIKKHIEIKGSNEGNTIYWLKDDDEVEKLSLKMGELFGDFWRHVSWLQYSGGFRPEELCWLQADKISNGNGYRVEVCNVMNGKTIVWKPKTKQSYGKSPIWQNGVDSLFWLKNLGGKLLVPNRQALHKGVTTRHKDEFSKAWELWSGESFTDQYLERLRKAAEAVALDSKRVDSRTLRRCAGKRILRASKNDIILTAACLRDRPETVRKHYASVLPDDVVQPA